MRTHDEALRHFLASLSITAKEIDLLKLLAKKGLKYEDIKQFLGWDNSALIDALTKLKKAKLIAEPEKHYYQIYETLNCFNNKIITEVSPINLANCNVLVRSGFVFLLNINQATTVSIKNFIALLSAYGIDVQEYFMTKNLLTFPKYIRVDKRVINLAQVTYSFMSKGKKESISANERNIYRVNPEIIINSAIKFASHIKENVDEIVAELVNYETNEVALDEIARVIDLFENLRENKEYFAGMIGKVAVFLPSNQPLYAFACFACIPSYMAKQVFVRPPTAMQFFFNKLMKAIKQEIFFPNIRICFDERNQFIIKMTKAESIYAQSEASLKTDVVIFTGTSKNASLLRKKFNKSTLFIANGAGHNPLVVAENANVDSAVASSTKVQLFNQGQDCASPNAILVHKSLYDTFVKSLKMRLRQIKIGDYSDPLTQIGPLTRASSISKIVERISHEEEWLDQEFNGKLLIKKRILYPTIILKPLVYGGNYDEFFAPVFFIQRYEKDEDLHQYFNNTRYIQNAMYITVFGNSKYIDSISEKSFFGRHIHPQKTIIRETDLHAPGVERGVNEYGGYGDGASSISYQGKMYFMPTLPQRDIYKFLIANSYLQSRIRDIQKATSVLESKIIEETFKISKQNNAHHIPVHFFPTS